MNDIAIRVENLSKQYKLGATVRHNSLKDLFTSGLNGLFSRPSRLPPDSQHSTLNSPPSDYIWALKDVSFDVKQGEVVGIIGQNGAGKSTLLKILSRITEPTRGRVEVYGRTSSMLEVGTGVHPELTGRENIYLSGAVLGMTQSEVNRKFDEIVDFSGVEKFLDTPIKRYSSGMQVRLIFSVAAHLEPEILIIDEVLAVGDAAFQKKCLGKMDNVAKRGRTVLFVSHNMSAILRLCPEAMLLDAGQIIVRGPSSAVVEQYLDTGGEKVAERIWTNEEVPSDCGPFRPIALRVLNAKGSVTGQVHPAQPFSVEIEYHITKAVDGMRIGVHFLTSQRKLLFASYDVDDLNRYEQFRKRTPGHYVTRCHVPANLFNSGVFMLALNAGIARVCLLFHENAVTFTVDETAIVGQQWLPERRGGFFRPALKWDIECPKG